MSNMDEPEVSAKAPGSDALHGSATSSNARVQDSAGMGVNMSLPKALFLKLKRFQEHCIKDRPTRTLPRPTPSRPFTLKTYMIRRSSYRTEPHWCAFVRQQTYGRRLTVPRKYPSSVMSTCNPPEKRTSYRQLTSHRRSTYRSLAITHRLLQSYCCS
jgi:hypothetical protein